MTTAISAQYRHRQWGPWHVVLYGAGALSCILAFVIRHVHPAPTILLIGGLVLLALAPCFHFLTIADDDDRLSIRFGPLPLFQTSIRYEDIKHVEIGRTWLIEGWGVHYSLRGGWVWNIWGRDCLVIRSRGTFRLGTNDAENLLAFLTMKISTHTSQR